MLSERTRDTLLVVFAVTGGAFAWTFQLWLAWILGEPLCLLQPGEFVLLGLGSAALWVAIGLVSGAIALAALVASWRQWRSAGGRELREEPALHGPRRFLVYTGLVLNALFLLTIVLGTTAPLWLTPCV
jgi:hypothetical protein